MSKYIVSLNLTKNLYKNGQLIESNFINPKPCPILFYSNKESDFKSELINNEQLYDLLTPLKAFDYMSYSNITINGIKYNIDSQEFVEEEIPIQDVFLLKDIKDGEQISLNIIEFLLNKMYVRCQGDPNLMSNDIKENINIIYSHIKEVYPNEFSASAIENYISDKLENVTRLNKDNTSYVFNKFKEVVD